MYALKSDPGEKTNVIAEQPEVVLQLRAAYNQWWNDVQPLLVNEDVTPVTINPFQEQYYKQFGGSPSEQVLAKMAGKPQPGGNAEPRSKEDRAKRRKAR